MFEILTVIAVILGLLFFLFFVLLKRAPFSTRILGVYMLLLAIEAAEPYFHGWSLFQQYPILIPLLGGTYLLIGPVLLFYTKFQLYSEFKLKAGHLIHFIPCSLYFILLPVIFQMGIADDFLLDWIVYEFLFAQIFAYGFYSLFLLGREKKQYHLGEVVQVKRIRLAWLKALLISSMILFGTGFLVTHIQLIITSVQFTSNAYFIIQLILASIVLMIALLNTDSMNLKRFQF